MNWHYNKFNITYLNRYTYVRIYLLINYITYYFNLLDIYLKIRELLDRRVVRIVKWDKEKRSLCVEKQNGIKYVHFLLFLLRLLKTTQSELPLTSSEVVVCYFPECQKKNGKRVLRPSCHFNLNLTTSLPVLI